ncbi:MAG TPA: DUF1775 domain-containing protein [Acidimicrobiia bacterium]|nr:DUF1775 domain-containing protein [Acidimicrobiia bacterium]
MGNRREASPRRTRRLAAATAVVAGLAVAAVPGVAWAHAVFLSSGSVPANSDQKLTLNVPEEKGPNVHNTKVVVVVPAGFSVSGCDQKKEWTCAVSPASGNRTVVTYTRSGGTDADARFSFGVHTPAQAGDYPFNTNQSYSDNSTERWDGPPGSDTPAPVLKVT